MRTFSEREASTSRGDVALYRPIGPGDDSIRSAVQLITLQLRPSVILVPDFVPTPEGVGLRAASGVPHANQRLSSQDRRRLNFTLTQLPINPLSFHIDSRLDRRVVHEHDPVRRL
jgi:hypothetical protein